MCNCLQDVKPIELHQNNGSLYIPEWLLYRNFTDNDCNILVSFSKITSINKFSQITKEKIDFFTKNTNYDISYKLLKVLGLYGVKFFNRSAIHSPILFAEPIILETKKVKNQKIQLIKFGSCLLDFNVRRQTIDKIIDFLRKTEFEYSHQLNGIRLDTLALKTDLNIDLISEVLSSANFNIINNKNEISIFYNNKPLEIAVDKGTSEICSIDLKEEQSINYSQQEVSSNNNSLRDDNLFILKLEDNKSKLSMEMNDDLSSVYFSVRAQNVLAEYGIKTISQLISLTDEEILAFRNCGIKTLEEIREIIRKNKNQEEKIRENKNEDKNNIQSHLFRLNGKLLSFNDSINFINFSTRAYNVLNENNIKTINELMNLTDEQIISFKNSGIKTLNEIKDTIKKINLNFFHIDELKENLFYVISDKFTLSENTNILLSKLNIKTVWQLLIHFPHDILNQPDSSNINYEELKDLLSNLGYSKYPIQFTNEQVEELTKPSINEALNSNPLEAIALFSTYMDNIVNNEFNERYKVVYEKRIKPQKKATLEEIGQIFDLSRERIRQMEVKLLRKLRRPKIVANYFKQISKILSCLFNEYGKILHFNLFQSNNVINSLTEEDKNLIFIFLQDCSSISFNIDWKLKVLYKTDIGNLDSLCYPEEIFINNFYSIKYSYIYDIVIKKFSPLINKNNLAQERNFDSIINEIISYIINKYLNEVDNGIYKTVKKNESIYDYATYKFSEMFPKGAYVYKDGNEVVEKLCQSLPQLKDKSIRAIIARIISRNDDILLWGPGFYIHKNNINPDWQLVDLAVERCIELFKQGITDFKINKIFSEKEEIFKKSAIPTTQALYSLLRFPAYFEINIKNIRVLKIHLGNKKVKAIKEFMNRKFSKEELLSNLRKLSFTSDEIKTTLNYSKILRSERLILEEYPRICDAKVGKVKKTFTEIINNYFIEKKNFVPLEQLREFFCLERGWKEYELYQVLDRLAEIIPTERGYIHLKYFNYDLDKLSVIIKKIEEKLSSVNNIIHLRKIREDCNVSWIDVCNYDIRPETMGILLANTENKNFKIEKRIYAISYCSELPGDINLIQILSELLLERKDFVSISEIQQYFKERGFIIPSFTDLIKKSGMLKYFKCSYIHPNIIGYNDNMLEEIEQIIEEASLVSESKDIPYTSFSWIIDNLYEKLPPLQNDFEWNTDLLSSVTDKIDNVMVFNGVYVLYRNKFAIEDLDDLLGFIIIDKYKNGICKVSVLEKELKSLEILPIDNSLLSYSFKFSFKDSSVELVDEQNNIMLSKIGREKYLKYEYI